MRPEPCRACGRWPVHHHACKEALVSVSPCAQIPYTVAKFVVFEHVARGLRAHAAGAAPAWPSSVDLPPAHAAAEVHLAALSPAAAAAVNLGAGLVAGCVAALVSQPADTLLSRINRAKAAPGAPADSAGCSSCIDAAVYGVLGVSLVAGCVAALAP